MPLTVKQKSGNTFKAYLNTGTTESRVWLLLGEITTNNLEVSDEAIDTTSKADRTKTFTKGIPQIEIPIEYQYEGDDDGWDALCQMGDPQRSPDMVRELTLLPVAIADVDGGSAKTDGSVYAVRLYDFNIMGGLNEPFKIKGTFKQAKNAAYPALFSSL